MAVTGVNEYTNAYAASNSAGAKGSSGLSETAFGKAESGPADRSGRR